MVKYELFIYQLCYNIGNKILRAQTDVRVFINPYFSIIENKTSPNFLVSLVMNIRTLQYLANLYN